MSRYPGWSEPTARSRIASARSIQRLGLGVAALPLIEIGQIVQRARHVGMVAAQHFFADRQRAPDQRLGLGIAALDLVDLAEIVQQRRDRGMLGPAAFS